MLCTSLSVCYLQCSLHRVSLLFKKKKKHAQALPRRSSSWDAMVPLQVAQVQSPLSRLHSKAQKKKKKKTIPKHLIKYVCNVLSDSHGKVY